MLMPTTIHPAVPFIISVLIIALAAGSLWVVLSILELRGLVNTQREMVFSTLRTIGTNQGGLESLSESVDDLWERVKLLERSADDKGAAIGLRLENLNQRLNHVMMAFAESRDTWNDARSQLDSLARQFHDAPNQKG